MPPAWGRQIRQQHEHKSGDGQKRDVSVEMARVSGDDGGESEAGRQTEMEQRRKTEQPAGSGHRGDGDEIRNSAPKQRHEIRENAGLFAGLEAG